MAKAKDKGGAPTLCNRVVKSSIVSSFRRGLSKAKICEDLGIDEVTVNDWIDQDKTFSNAIDNAMELYLKHGTIKSITDLASGYTETVVTSVVKRLDKDTGQMRVVKEESVVTKHPPDYRSLRFILHNRFRGWSKPSVSQLDITKVPQEHLIEMAKECIAELDTKKEE